MSDSNPKKPEIPPSKPTKPETETVHPTDVSLVCDDPARHKKEPQRPTSKRSYQLLLVFGLMLVFLLIMGYRTLFGYSKLDSTELVIEEGQSYYGIIPQFQRDVPMFSASLAKLYIKSTVDAPLHAGTYEIPKNASFKQVMDAFAEGQKIDMVTIQIIEGKVAADLYNTIANTEGVTLEVLESNGKPKPNFKQLLGIAAFTPEGEYANNLEGWFTPDTYYYAKGVTDKQILIDLYQRQQQALEEAWESRDVDLPYDSPYEALIMASIIEKETAIASERGLVSAVFVNRLKKGMRLQTDPTIIYGMGERYGGNIRRTDIDEKTAYNTYQIDGLPPTPIALPSKESIEAAMHPADSDVLYFVATGNGGHKFTRTLAEHNRAVQQYLTVLREQKNSQ